MTDPLLDLVARLPQATAPAVRAQRTRDRCQRILARRSRRGTGTRPAHMQAWVRALVGIGALYFVEGVRLVVRLYAAR